MSAPTRKMAAFLAELKFEQIPSDVIEQAKKCLLDFLGVALCGANEPGAIKMFEFFKKFGGTAEAMVIRQNHRTSVPWAALVNGTMTHGLELDDGHIEGHVHPGVTAIPAILAVGEKKGVSGKDLLKSIVAGYEAVIRVGDAVTPSAIYDRGMHAPGLVGASGASAAVGSLLNLPEQKMIHALGNCCLAPVAPFQTFIEGAAIKELYGGWPALVGTLAATMAADGFSGPARFFEGPKGFCRSVANNPDLNKVTDRLGQRWRILETYFKHHASCSFSHTTVDAVLAIVSRETVEPENVERIVVRTHKFASDLAEKRPDSIPAKKSSIPYCIAVAVLKKQVFLDEFDHLPGDDKKILQLVDKVEMVADSELEQLHIANEGIRPARVEIYMKDGRFYGERKDVAKGWPENPLSMAELEGKFFRLAGSCLPEDRCKTIRDLVMGLEQFPDISRLVNALA